MYLLCLAKYGKPVPDYQSVHAAQWSQLFGLRVYSFETIAILHTQNFINNFQFIIFAHEASYFCSKELYLNRPNASWYYIVSNLKSLSYF